MPLRVSVDELLELTTWHSKVPLWWTEKIIEGEKPFTWPSFFISNDGFNKLALSVGLENPGIYTRGELLGYLLGELEAKDMTPMKDFNLKTREETDEFLARIVHYCDEVQRIREERDT